MIQDELRTAFRWYNDINKQNRYKSQCEATCDFKLLTNLNSLLDFQILTDQTGIPTVINSWGIYCVDGGLYVDLTSQIATCLSVATAGDRDYISYRPWQDAISATIECGYYYSIIETTNGTYFSEIFYSTDASETVETAYTYPLPTAWRYYDRQAKAERFKEQCKNVCDYYLISGNDALIPFQFRKIATGNNTVTRWVLRAIDGSCEHVLDHNLFIVAVAPGFNSFFYYYYLGDAIPDLPCGVFESIVTAGGVEFFSEPIKIISDMSTNTLNYILLETGSGGGVMDTEAGVGILTEGQ